VVALLGLAWLVRLVVTKRGTWPPEHSAAAALLATASERLSEDPGLGRAAYITWAEYPYKCLHISHISGRPGRGTRVETWDCPVDKALITLFLLPLGGQGPMRLAEDPKLCLRGKAGSELQLWPCMEAPEVAEGRGGMSFLVRPEAAAWVKIPHFDLPDEDDVEHMSAKDIGVVMRRAERLGYMGFSVFNGTTAWLKKARKLTKGDLRLMPSDDPVVFYVFRPRGEFTIRLAEYPGTCVLVPGNGIRNGVALRMANCSSLDEPERAVGTSFSLHFIHSVEREQEPKGSLAQQGGVQKPVVTMVMTVANVDYTLLSAKPALLADFMKTVREVVAAEAGHGITPEQVTPSLAAGSIRVVNEIAIPGDVPPNAVQSELASSGTLNRTLAERVRSLADIDEVSTGDIWVTGAQAVVRESRGPALLAWSGALVAILLAAGLGLFHLRGHLRSLRPRQLQRFSTSGMAESSPRPQQVVWRLGRIIDRGRPNSVAYHVALDNGGSGQRAALCGGEIMDSTSLLQLGAEKGDQLAD